MAIFVDSNNALLPVHPVFDTNIRGFHLAGAKPLRCNKKGVNFVVHSYKNDLFEIELINFELCDEPVWQILKSEGFLFIVCLVGNSFVLENGEISSTVRAGEYILCSGNPYRFRTDKARSVYLVFYLTEDFAQELLIVKQDLLMGPQALSPSMRGHIDRILDNPFNGELLRLDYDCALRDLLFSVRSYKLSLSNAWLAPDELATVLAADRLLSEDFSETLLIGDLARRCLTNQTFLKIGFQKVFGMGVGARSLMKRMDYARKLLEQTDKQIQEIAYMVGYQTIAGFNHAFKRINKISPGQWRRKYQGQPSGG